MIRLTRAVVAGLALLALASTARAQANDPLSGFAVDARLLTTSLPSTSGWAPVLPAGGVVPSRGFGGSIDAQRFLGPGRNRRLAVGISSLWAQGRSSDATTATTVTTRMMAAGPMLTANFGHRLGWSYFTAGAALAKVRSFASGDSDPSGAAMAYHYGFGGKWFLTDRLGLSLDLRFWALTPRSASSERVKASAATKVAFGGGVVFR